MWKIVIYVENVLYLSEWSRYQFGREEKGVRN